MKNVKNAKISKKDKEFLKILKKSIKLSKEEKLKLFFK